MSIIVPELNEHYDRKLQEYEEMTIFVERCKKQIKNVDKIIFQVELVEAGYYSEREHASWFNFLGIGARTFDTKDRKSYDKKDEALSISLKTTIKQLNSISDKISSIKVTVGGHGNTNQPCFDIPIFKPGRYGLCKKEFFDEGFQLMKKIHPDITVEEIAVFGTKSSKSAEFVYTQKEKYNEDFVEERIINDKNIKVENCILWRHDSNIPDENEINVEFSIMTCDIERNSDLLIVILAAL